jgi:hypothetical protein
MLFRPDSFLLQVILVPSLLISAAIGATPPSTALAQTCDISFAGDYEQVAVPNVETITNLVVGDYNADGRPDFVTNPGGAAPYPGSGVPSPGPVSFTPHHMFLGTPNGIVPGPDLPSAVTQVGAYLRAIDLNEDGKLDLIAGGFPPVVWYGHGDGSFDAPIPIPGLPATGVNAIWTVDLNGDHHLDLVSLVQDPDAPYEIFDRVRTFLANGSGGFIEGPALALPSEVYQYFIRAGDLNGDGRGDLVVVVAPQEELHTWALIYFGDGTGGFQPPVTLHESTSSPFDGLVDVLDWNGDGKLDIALSARTRLDLYFGNGDGTFSAPVATDGALDPNFGSAFTLGDLNGDSIPDITQPDQTGSRGFQVRLGSPDGHVGAPRAYPGLPFSNFTLVQAVGGPAPDLITPFYNELLIYENLAGTFDEVPFAPYPRSDKFTSPPVPFCRAADLNGDKRTDFVFYRQGAAADTFFVELTTPALTLNQTQVISFGARVYEYQLSDITGDGIPELVVLRGGTISVFLGLPGGTFGARLDRTYTSPSREGVLYMLLGDLNRDGFGDILLSRVTGMEPTTADQMAGVAFLAGHGDGTFDPAVDLFRSFGLFSPVLRDVNGDGTPDLLASEASHLYNQPGYDAAITVRLANGDGTFGAPTAVLTPGGSLQVEDVNGDGHPDLFLYRSVFVFPVINAYAAQVCLGQGDGTFSAPVTTAADSVEYVSFLGDLNADGRADLIGADLAQPAYRVFCGQPDGTFVEVGRLGVGYVGPLFGTDMDGDGGVDIAAVGSRIEFHRNRLVSIGPVVASMTLDPPVIQPRSRGPWVRVTLELGAGHNVSEVDVASLRLLGVPPVEKSAQIGDVDSDGIPDLTVAFPREPFQQLAAGEQIVTLTGHLISGVSIQAQTTIRVLETHGKMALRVTSPLGASPVVLDISNAAGPGRTVRIFDVMGRVVRSWEERNAVDQRVTWDGRTARGTNAPSGIYFTRVSTPSGEATARTVLLR